MQRHPTQVRHHVAPVTLAISGRVWCRGTVGVLVFSLLHAAFLRVHATPNTVQLVSPDSVVQALMLDSTQATDVLGRDGPSRIVVLVLPRKEQFNLADTRGTVLPLFARYVQ